MAGQHIICFYHSAWSLSGGSKAQANQSNVRRFAMPDMLLSFIHFRSVRRYRLHLRLYPRRAF